MLGFDADYRRSPLLELNDALIGQSAPDLNALAMQFTPSQIRQLALDRTVHQRHVRRLGQPPARRTLAVHGESRRLCS